MMLCGQPSADIFLGHLGAAHHYVEPCLGFGHAYTLEVVVDRGGLICVGHCHLDTALRMGGDRYGAPSKDLPLSPGVEGPMKKYTLNVDASSAQSWKIPAGTYDITADFAKMTVKAAVAQSGVEVTVAAHVDSVPVCSHRGDECEVA